MLLTVYDLGNFQHKGTYMGLAKIISFINMKGGVGKTTLCIGLADYLSNFMDKKVLVLDVDPQFNTTQSFLYKYDLTERYLSELKANSIRKIFQRPDDIHSHSAVPTKEIIYSLTDKLNIVFGDINLIFDNNTNDIAKVKRIKNLLMKIDFEMNMTIFLLIVHQPFQCILILL